MAANGMAISGVSIINGEGKRADGILDAGPQCSLLLHLLSAWMWGLYLSLKQIISKHIALL
jgi:hypothetical protein